MKKRILLLLVVFTIQGMFSQKNIFSRYKKTTVYFKNGEVKQGISKVTFFENLKFKKNKKQKKAEVLTSESVDKFIIGLEEKKVEYQYKLIKGEYGKNLLSVKQRGKVSIYYKVKTSSGPSIGFGGFGVSMATSTEVYYISKKDSDNVIQLFNMFGTSKRIFKKIVPEFFADCPELIDKIKKKEYKKNDIIKIVDFYNTKCQEKE